MEFRLVTCQTCGLLDQIRISRHGDYVHVCKQCQAPLVPAREVVSVGATTGYLELKQVPGRGLGVFARVDLPSETLVERCPVLVFDRLPEGLLKHEVFPYADGSGALQFGHLLLPWVRDDMRALVLGYAMLYNHEPLSKSNVRYDPYVDSETGRRFLDFYTRRDVRAGVELTQTYTSTDNLWFAYKAGV